MRLSPIWPTRTGSRCAWPGCEAPARRAFRRSRPGERSVGRAALERRAQLVPVGDAAAVGAAEAAIIAPMVAGNRLVGIIGLAVRASRPTGRGELLLAQAFATRVGEIIAAGGTEAEARLARALERFHASWSATTGA